MKTMNLEYLTTMKIPKNDFCGLIGIGFAFE